jgi:hypothetical protein
MNIKGMPTSVAKKMMEKFDASHIPLLRDGRITLGSAILPGVELLQVYSEAQRLITQLDFIMEEITEVLEGPTHQERLNAIAAEDASPEAAARRMGWTTEKELKAGLEAEGHKFHHWICNNPTIVCRKREGGGLPNYLPERHHSAFDYLACADSWADALKMGRKMRSDATAARVKKGIGW